MNKSIHTILLSKKRWWKKLIIFKTVRWQHATWHIININVIKFIVHQTWFQKTSSGGKLTKQLIIKLLISNFKGEEIIFIEWIKNSITLPSHCLRQCSHIKIYTHYYNLFRMLKCQILIRKTTCGRREEKFEQINSSLPSKETWSNFKIKVLD